MACLMTGGTRSAVDLQAVTQVTTAIIALNRRSLIDLGQAVLDGLFAGNWARYKTSDPRGASLRALASCCRAQGNPISCSTLSRAVSVAGVAAQLPPTSAFRRLGPSLQIELLKLGEPERIESLAEDLLHEGLTVADVRSIVAVRAAGTPSGAVQVSTGKRLIAALRAVTGRTTKLLSSDLSLLSGPEREVVIRCIADTQSRLAQVARALSPVAMSQPLGRRLVPGTARNA